MNSQQLYALIKRDTLLSNMFLGFYSMDDVFPEMKGFFIVNTDKRGNVGKHWVVYFKSDENDEFFDSCGENGDYYGLVKKKEFNKYKLQGNHPFCGYYCLCYCLMRCRSIPLIRIIFSIIKIHNSQRDLYIATKVIKHFGVTFKL